ncbi:MAG: YggT family protein [Spirulina sp. SIO3F2]|nr:YggT family protein [Spirulina sp. SIO3F2]
MDISIARLITVSLYNFLSIYSFILIVRLLLTWLPMVSWAQQLAATLSPITDPYLNIFRSFLPPMGGFDFSPILALLTLQFLGPFIIRMLAGFLYTFV